MDDEPLKPYKVGYCNPPLHTRFKPNTSGNRSGRPKRQIKARSLHDLLRDPVTVKEGGKKTKVPLINALHKRLLLMALDGNLKAIGMILKIEHAPPINNDDDETDFSNAPRPIIVIKTVSGRLRPKGEEHISPNKALEKPENPEES